MGRLPVLRQGRTLAARRLRPEPGVGHPYRQGRGHSAEWEATYGTVRAGHGRRAAGIPAGLFLPHGLRCRSRTLTGEWVGLNRRIGRVAHTCSLMGTKPPLVRLGVFR